MPVCPMSKIVALFRYQFMHTDSSLFSTIANFLKEIKNYVSVVYYLQILFIDFVFYGPHYM